MSEDKYEFADRVTKDTINPAWERVKRYQDDIQDSNDTLHKDVIDMYTDLKKQTNQPEEGQQFNLADSFRDSSALRDRISSRLNIDSGQQNSLNDSEKLAQRLTSANLTGRLNQASKLSDDKHSFDAYTGLFSQYIGNLSGETNIRKTRVTQMNKHLYDINRRTLKNAYHDINAKEKYENSTAGKIRRGIEQIGEQTKKGWENFKDDVSTGMHKIEHFGQAIGHGVENVVHSVGDFISSWFK